MRTPMVSPKKQERLKELDSMLAAGGVCLETVAEAWGVGPARVYQYLVHLKFDGKKIKSEWHDVGDKKVRIFHYVDGIPKR